MADPTKAPTVSEYLERWLGEAARTARHDRHLLSARAEQLRLHVLPHVGDVPIDQLTAEHIALVQRAALETVNATMARIVMQGSFAALLRAARHDDLLVGNPLAGLEWPDQERREPDPFDDADVERIIAHFRAERPSALPLVAFAFWAGLRPSEAAGVRWADVGLGTGICVVHSGRVAGERTGGKTGERPISLSPRLVRLLKRERRARQPREWTIAQGRDGQPIDAPSWSSSTFQPALRELGIRPRSFFHARHTFIIAAIERGAMPAHVAFYCGLRKSYFAKTYAAWLEQPAAEGIAD